MVVSVFSIFLFFSAGGETIADKVLVAVICEKLSLVLVEVGVELAVDGAAHVLVAGIQAENGVDIVILWFCIGEIF